MTVDELVQMVIDASGKEIHIKHMDGPVRVHSRNFTRRAGLLVGVAGQGFLGRGHLAHVSVGRGAGECLAGA